MAKNNKKSRKKHIIIISVIVLIVLLVVAKRYGLLGREPLDKVTVEQPKERTITELITASGKIQPEVEVKIAPEVSGEIIDLPFQEGDYVNKGDLIVRIKPDTYVSAKERAEAAVNSSKSQLMQAEAALLQAEQTYNRQKKLYEEKVISPSEYEAAEASYLQSKAQVEASRFNVESAEATLKEAKENLFKTTIYAPSSGTISLLSVEVGERVVGTAQMAGTEMLRIADLSRMEVRAEVNENDIVRVSLGDTAIIDVDAYLNKKFKGVVTRIANSSVGSATGASASVDQVTNYEVRIYILPESYADISTAGSISPFRPGMSTSVDIQTATEKGLAIPIQAITMRMTGDVREEVVWLYNAAGSTVSQIPIKSGIQDKQYIIIKEGLDTTQKIVTAPFTAISKGLKDGKQVELNQDVNMMMPLK